MTFRDRKSLIISLLSLTNIVFVVTLLSLYFWPKDTIMNSVRLFETSSSSVVEVKAVEEGVGESFGTGAIVSSSGDIITNAHVVTRQELGERKVFKEYFVRLAFEKNYRPVNLSSYDISKDLALLKLLDSNTLKPLFFKDSSLLKPGERVFSLGNASNCGVAIFEGIISKPLLKVNIDKEEKEVIQCDLTTASGCSGGPLIDEKGKLAGIVTFRMKDKKGNIIYGIVYCVPSNLVKSFYEKNRR